ncbi:MAG: DUF2956 domain-containing protein [Thiohalomonadales bacterium]
MPKYSKNQSGDNPKYNKPSPNTIETADKIAKGSKKEGQSKQQTKLISQGIQKGIEQYKKQEKAKSKELDKRQKKRLREKLEPINESVNEGRYRQHWLPWVLLLLTWIANIVYWVMAKT